MSGNIKDNYGSPFVVDYRGKILRKSHTSADQHSGITSCEFLDQCFFNDLQHFGLYRGIRTFLEMPMRNLSSLVFTVTRTPLKCGDFQIIPTVPIRDRAGIALGHAYP